MNRAIPRFLVALVSAGFLVGTVAPGAGAVEPHQHLVNTPAGAHDIARGFCNGDFGSARTQNVALSNFHFGIHVGPQGPDGVVTIGAHGC